MSQWGEAKTFVRGDIKVRLIPHVMTEAFEPIRDHSMITELFLMDQPRGDPQLIAQLILAAQEKYLKQPYTLWMTENL